MLKHHSIVAASIVLSIVLNYQARAFQDSPDAKTVRRVKRVSRPVFAPADSQSLFFKDVYAQGTVGQRPSVVPQLDSNIVNRSEEPVDELAQDSWTQIIEAAVIEDEVKTLQQELNGLVTTPVVFQTKFNDVNQRFSILSTLFAIIRQYDGDVRWIEHAAAAQALFQQANVASRTGALKGFQFCKSRRDDLETLVRGGSIATNENVPEEVDWEMAADRSAIMVYLETANEDLKQMTSDVSEFRSNTDRIFHYANMVAAFAKVINQPGMPESEEDSYADFSDAMRAAAMELKSSSQTGNFKRASSAANVLSQSCADCHQEWR